MNDEIIRELTKIQQFSSQMQSLLREAESQAPAHAEGADPSGSVSIELDPSGLPESIHVDRNWQRRVDPGSFGEAVNAAFAAASGKRMEKWTEALNDSGWKADFERLQSGSSPVAAAPQEGSIPPAFRSQPAPDSTRSLDTLAEDMMKALDNVDGGADQASKEVQGIGKAGSGKLTLTLSKQSGMCCAADPGWVAQQTAARLMTALSDALAQARASLASEEEAEPQNTASGLDSLFQEAMDALNDPQRAAGY